MYCEDYIDPFDRDPDDDEEGIEDDAEADQWECAYPGACLMPSPDHRRSECYTIEDAEAYYSEVEGVGV